MSLTAAFSRRQWVITTLETYSFYEFRCVPTQHDEGNTTMLLPEKLRHTEFHLESVGLVVVSTIELPPIFVDEKPRYETAIIWDQQDPLDDGYYIAWCGYTKHVALTLHEAWCCPDALARLIHHRVSISRN